VRILGSFALLLWAATASFAHHGFTGRYDTDRPIFIVGTVDAVSSAPPHATITLVVAPSAIAPPTGADRPGEITADMIAADPSVVGRRVTVEFPPIAAFFALGDTVKPGDVVEIVALRNCRAPHQLRSQWIRTPGREIVRREGRLSYMARGCGGS
jgi:Family of unknown function (DUF6152)